MVAIGDLKSPVFKACRFESGPGHHIKTHWTARMVASELNNHHSVF